MNEGTDYFLNEDFFLDLKDERNQKLTMQQLTYIVTTTASLIHERGCISWWGGYLLLWSGLGSKDHYAFKIPCAVDWVPHMLLNLLDNKGPKFDETDIVSEYVK